MLDDDARFMAAALALGRRGLGQTASNPSVGALIVKDGLVVGRGCTAAGGRPHAEQIALAQAGEAARGATLYVTLEPCSHHGQTPPCCVAVAAAGIARVVFGTVDPDPRVSGRGLAFLRAHGVAIDGPVREAEAREHHAGHLTRVTKGRPFVCLKLAETADGFAAGGRHDPRLAITGMAANGVIHVLRSLHDAIMVGIGTLRADDPLMTVRLPGLAVRPLRIVLDSALECPPQSRLLQTASQAPVLLIAASDADPARKAALESMPGVEVATIAAAANGRLRLDAALNVLAERGLTRIFSEGGPRIAAGLIEDDLVDDVLLFTAPRPLMGDGIPALSQRARSALDRYVLVEDRAVGLDRLRRWRKPSCSQDSSAT